MPRADWCRPEIYALFDRWRRTCLGADGAMFSAAVVWTEANLTALQTRLSVELSGSGTYLQKLASSLVPQEPVIRQLGVETAYLEYVGELDTGPDPKRRNFRQLAQVLPEGVTVPDELIEFLDGGIASYGPGAGSREAYVRLLVRLARHAKDVVAAEGAEALDNPWRFRALVREVGSSSDALQANAVLHACFPDEFDVVLSSSHRRKLRRHFAGGDIVAAAEDEDRALLAVRRVLRERLPDPVEDVYYDAITPIWDGTASAEFDALTTRVMATLGPAAAEDDGAPLPEPDADLLERLQEAIGSNQSWKRVLTEAAARIAARGGTVRSWAPLIEALRAAIDVAPPPPPPPPAAKGLRAATPELAADLMLRQSWLQGVLDILGKRRQVVLYGPPGTGKTWLARKVAEHAFAPGDVRLVQFHPSYAYEDFVEGYRPVTTNGEGGFTYKLLPGPLLALAKQAGEHPERPHLLIVDEINRGNLPKIFGELYFLLEYRNEPLRLQYSGDTEFRLPENLHVLGTMNTADRSIALLDAALRRRFAFLELSPRSEPIRGLLRRWLEHHELDPEPHVLLATLNDMLAEEGDQDLAIGPSYFMSRSGEEPDLETIWEYDLLPLLVERFYGSGGAPVSERFSLDTVREEARRRADVSEP